jgi:uncharacterized protein YneF (UPF0154 family)
MSNPPVSDRALRGALSLPGINAGASRAILVIRPPVSIRKVRALVKRQGQQPPLTF